MATLNLQVGANTDDAYEHSSGASYAEYGSYLVYGDYFTIQHSGHRFTGVSGLSGSTITSALMTFTARDTDSDAFVGAMYAQESAAPGAFDSSANDVTDRTRTSASAAAGSAELGNWTAESEYTLDVATIIQELADSYDPSAIVMLYINTSGTGQRRSYSHDGDNAKAVKLDITYTVAGGDATLTAAGAALAAVAALPTAALTADAVLSAGNASVALAEAPDATMTATVAGTMSADLVTAAAEAPTASFTADATLSADTAALAVVDVPAATIFAGGYDYPQILSGDQTIRVDRAEYPTTALFYLEVTMLTSSASQSARAKLYNITDSVDVTGSDISSTSTTFESARSAAFNLPAGIKEYRVVGGGDIGGQYEFTGIPLLLGDV